MDTSDLGPNHHYHSHHCCQGECVDHTREGANTAVYHHFLTAVVVTSVSLEFAQVFARASHSGVYKPLSGTGCFLQLDGEF